MAAVWAYWCRKRASAFAPRPADINPAEIIRCLPHLQFITRDPDGEFRYGLTGNAIADGHGVNPAHKRLPDVVPPARMALARRHYGQVWRSGKPEATRSIYPLPSGAEKVVSRLILPLSDDGKSVTALLVAQTFQYATSYVLDANDDWSAADRHDRSALLDANRPPGA